MTNCTLPGSTMIGSGYINNGSEDEIRGVLEVIFTGCIRDKDTPYRYVLICTKKPSGARLAWKLFRLVDKKAISSKKVDEIHSQFHVFLCRKSDGKPIVTKEYKAILEELLLEEDE
jgi:hypothetical protein